MSAAFDFPAWLTGAGDHKADTIHQNARAVLYDWARERRRDSGSFANPREFRIGTLIGTFADGKWSVRHEKLKRTEIEYGAAREVTTAPWDPRAHDTRQPTFVPKQWERPELSRRIVEVEDPAAEADADSLQAALNRCPQ